jgi:DNA-directed RNA polymerase specialized sigma24 family protein
MHPPLSKTDLVTILDEADAATTRLRHRLRLSHADQEDLRQDLLLDLIRRLPAFDANRGSIGAFAGIVLRNQSARIAARVVRDRRAAGGPLLPLNALAGDGSSLADRLSETDGLSAWHGHCGNVEAAIDARIDLARMLGALHARDRSLCAAAAGCRLHLIEDRGLGSRATIYRRLRDLRCALAAHGARAA